MRRIIEMSGALAVCAIAFAGAAACDGGGNGTTDTAIDTVIDDPIFDSTGDASEDPVLDTTPEAVEDPIEDEVLDCSGMYPGGPFGFKGSIYRATPDAIGTWDGGGDLMQNICMQNQDDEYTCVAPYYCSAEVDVLIYDFTAMWCPPCNAAAGEEAEFVAWMQDHGWTVEFLSMLEENVTAERPTLADAQYWKSYHDIEGPIMWDYNWRFHTAPFVDTRPEESLRGWPTFLIVNPDNMLIWDAFSGWYGAPTTQEQFFGRMLQIFEIGAANDPDYIP